MSMSVSHWRLFRHYISAICKDRIALMSGGLGILFTFLAAYFAFFESHNIALFWLLALLAILPAGYRVWAKERVAFLAEQEKKANASIRGEIREVYFDHQVSMPTEDDSAIGMAL